MYTKSIVYFTFLLLAVACQKSEQEENWTLVLPSHFPAPVYDISKNPTTQKGFELGKKLFFDPRLSSTGQISCGDCHQQYAGFAHADHVVSHGIHDRDGLRNAQHLVNLIYQKSYFWDGGVQHMDAISIRPLLDTLEMGTSMSQVLYTLNQIPEYQKGFRQAFPHHRDTITSVVFLQAMSQFLGALISANSPYDQYFLGDSKAISTAAANGLKIFRSKCATCHTEPLLTDHTFKSNGLKNVKDIGRAEVTVETQDKYHFKVPSLRNVALTSPYMHDGRFKTIEEVINFYSEDISSEMHVDAQLRNLPEGGFQFTAEEKADLRAFLFTLTDRSFISNKMFYP